MENYKRQKLNMLNLRLDHIEKDVAKAFQEIASGYKWTVASEEEDLKRNLKQLYTIKRKIVKIRARFAFAKKNTRKTFNSKKKWITHKKDIREFEELKQIVKEQSDNIQIIKDMIPERDFYSIKLDELIDKRFKTLQEIEIINKIIDE